MSSSRSACWRTWSCRPPDRDEAPCAGARLDALLTHRGDRADVHDVWILHLAASTTERYIRLVLRRAMRAGEAEGAATTSTSRNFAWCAARTALGPSAPTCAARAHWRGWRAPCRRGDAAPPAPLPPPVPLPGTDARDRPCPAPAWPESPPPSSSSSPPPHAHAREDRRSVPTSRRGSAGSYAAPELNSLHQNHT
jgi:hypothetical protein